MAADVLLGDAAASWAHLVVFQPHLHRCNWAPKPLRSHGPAAWLSAARARRGYVAREELERTAKELQSQAAAEAPEESKEEKRDRVRRDLQKIQIWFAMAREDNRQHNMIVDAVDDKPSFLLESKRTEYYMAMFDVRVYHRQKKIKVYEAI